MGSSDHSWNQLVRDGILRTSRGVFHLPGEHNATEWTYWSARRGRGLPVRDNRPAQAVPILGDLFDRFGFSVLGYSEGWPRTFL